MRKHTQNVYIDIVSFICITLLLLTGILLRYILPQGSRGESFLGLTRHEWGDVHFWVAVVFAIIITIHLILHLPWIKAALFKQAKQ